MMGLVWIVLALALGQGPKEEPPAYVREGDRIEQEFRSYRDRLDRFSQSLRGMVTQERPALLPQLQEAAPAPVVAGYQVLPRIVETVPVDTSKPVSSFSYSWPITASYIETEIVKLNIVESDLQRAVQAADTVPPGMVANLIRKYRELATNQRTIDQYIQYNRFWQHSIAVDRMRFDQLTKVYDLMKSAEPDTAQAIRTALGTPSVPSFVRLKQAEQDRVVIQVPVYTDIEDQAFLASVKAAIEETWQAKDEVTAYAVELEFRVIPTSQIYPEGSGPKPGARMDVRTHAARFPADGAVLTTGVPSTHGFVGRYVAMGSGDLSKQTLAHEFGHVLGFNDGYIRGYRDLGDQGFEILELTSFFDDIMSAPRQGRVQAEHFKLIVDALKRRNLGI